MNTTLSKGFIALVSFAICLALLYWLQPVLLPVVLAILLTFLLSPLVTALQRRHVPRVPAVVLVVVLAMSLLGGVGWMLARQVTSLVDTFPQYEQNLESRLGELQGDGGGFLDKLQTIVGRISALIERNEAGGAPLATEGDTGEDASVRAPPLPVTVVQDSSPFQLGQIWSVLGPALQPFATVGLSVVLLLFMLIRREDLRDRLISLVGHGHVTVTTKALDEAGERVSRYLLTQALINGSYGVVVAMGLALIGVPYALLWGFFAALLRYIPYLGPWLAAILPIGLSVLVSPSWTPPVLVVGLFLALELVSNMVIEPWLYGRGIGVSETATLVMIAFWTWLWGPIGLVLATPLTVCLVVVGKYVPALGFFDTLLGDRPALEAATGFYQRLLARDEDEAVDIAESHFAENSLVQTFDELLVPALVRSRQDLERSALDAADHEANVSATLTITEELVSAQGKAMQALAAQAAREAGKATRDTAGEPGAAAHAATVAGAAPAGAP
ncbi:AI-2E family transporter, partial [Methylibium sp.]|uniref:AI-2E family transporter n=1 Tax=Methylibium sp. TaxID=2067992 RepID=UPI00180F3DC2